MHKARISGRFTEWYTDPDMTRHQAEPNKQHVNALVAALSDLARWDKTRSLAFRDNRTPYKVLVAEFMLQQTQTTTMMPYYERFIETWPDLRSLADAERDDVYKAFAGLGYYRRAGFLHDTAKQIVSDFDGEIPEQKEQLLTLPGIGPYTANAIASIAFGKRVAAVDGNIVRVAARLLRQPYVRSRQQDLNTVRDTMEAALAKMPDIHAGDINEALMDLSAAICKPKHPRCDDCPIQIHCQARKEGDAEAYPVTIKAADKPVDSFIYLVLSDSNGCYIKKRTESLLKDTFEFIRLDSISEAETLNLKNIRKIGQTKHVFSHRIWQIEFYAAEPTFSLVSEERPVLTINGRQYEPVSGHDLNSLPWSSLFKQVLKKLEQSRD